MPADVLQFVAGRGEIVGASLVRDPRVALIAFTGSKEVGLDILRAAGQTPPGQGFVKKVVCEMGGKNAIIVDDSADLDEAVLGVRQSAFGYSGQKCSACSRAIVASGVYDVFLRRLCRFHAQPGDRRPDGAGHRHRPGDRRLPPRTESASTSKSARAKGSSSWPARSRRDWTSAWASLTSARTSSPAFCRSIAWPRRRSSARSCR